MKEKIRPYLAALFCAALAAITIVASFTTASTSNTGGSSVLAVMSWMMPFLCFLPMCFIFSGTQMSQMQREIQELRQTIADLKSPPAV